MLVFDNQLIELYKGFGSSIYFCFLALLFLVSRLCSGFDLLVFQAL